MTERATILVPNLCLGMHEEYALLTEAFDSRAVHPCVPKRSLGTSASIDAHDLADIIVEQQ